MVKSKTNHLRSSREATGQTVELYEIAHTPAAHQRLTGLHGTKEVSSCGVSINRFGGMTALRRQRVRSFQSRQPYGCLGPLALILSAKV